MKRFDPVHPAGPAAFGCHATAGRHLGLRLRRLLLRAQAPRRGRHHQRQAVRRPQRLLAAPRLPDLRFRHLRQAQGPRPPGDATAPATSARPAANITPFVKDAYISYQFAPLHKLTARHPGHRWPGPTSRSSTATATSKRPCSTCTRSAPRAISAFDFSGSFDAAKKFNYSRAVRQLLRLQNETDKYKQIGARFIVNPTPNLMFEVYGDIAPCRPSRNPPCSRASPATRATGAAWV